MGKRGFATLSAERRKEIASLGGQASHDREVTARPSHEWNSQTARLAALKMWEMRRARQAAVNAPVWPK